jgi:hypothetical protein
MQSGIKSSLKIVYMKHSKGAKLSHEKYLGGGVALINYSI